MTKDEIMQLEGRELDTAVAEKVMGWKERVDFDYVDGLIARYVPGTNDVVRFEPSTDISTAWEVLDKLKISVIPQSISAPNDMKYLARIEEDLNQEEIQVFASTAPLAIGRAALLALMEVES